MYLRRCICKSSGTISIIRIRGHPDKLYKSLLLLSRDSHQQRILSSRDDQHSAVIMKMVRVIVTAMVVNMVMAVMMTMMMLMVKMTVTNCPTFPHQRKTISGTAKGSFLSSHKVLFPPRSHGMRAKIANMGHTFVYGEEGRTIVKI